MDLDVMNTRKKNRYGGARDLISKAIAAARESGDNDVTNLSNLADKVGVTKAVLYEAYKRDDCTVSLHSKLTAFISLINRKNISSK